jgi:hypothetical protein
VGWVCIRPLHGPLSGGAGTVSPVPSQHSRRSSHHRSAHSVTRCWRAPCCKPCPPPTPQLHPYQGLLLLTGSMSRAMPFTAVFFFGVISVWVGAALRLAKTMAPEERVAVDKVRA